MLARTKAQLLTSKLEQSLISPKDLVVVDVTLGPCLEQDSRVQGLQVLVRTAGLDSLVDDGHVGAAAFVNINSGLLFDVDVEV